MFLCSAIDANRILVRIERKFVDVQLILRRSAVRYLLYAKPAARDLRSNMPTVCRHDPAKGKVWYRSVLR
jgi:hypothetical protein